MLVLSDWITSSGKYKGRSSSKELTPNVIESAKDLIERVNLLLGDLEIHDVSVSSGFRSSQVNAKTPGAAKKSLHMTGKAVDLYDPDGTLGLLILKHHELLGKHGLWLESLSATKGWVHLDTGVRSAREIRVFIP